MSNQDKFVYCDRDPRLPGCKYWIAGKMGYITEAKAWDLTMMEGYGLMVRNGEKP